MGVIQTKVGSKVPEVHSVDGSEIRADSPVEVGGEHPIIYRVSAPSQVVVWDFSHQQYHLKLGGDT